MKKIYLLIILLTTAVAGVKAQDSFTCWLIGWCPNSPAPPSLQQFDEDVKFNSRIIANELWFPWQAANSKQLINLYDSQHGIGVQAHTTYFRSTNDFQFYKGGSHSFTQGDAGGGFALFTIKGSGKVGIGTSNPANILQVGNGGRLRVANDKSDYSLMGTTDLDGADNTRIVISGKDRGGVGLGGNIEYITTFKGNVDRNTLCTQMFAGVISARYVKITPLTYYGWKSMRADLITYTADNNDNTAMGIWKDQSQFGQDAGMAEAGQRPVFKANGFNFNSVLLFDGTDDNFQVAPGFSDFTGGLSAFSPTLFSGNNVHERFFDFGQDACPDNIIFSRYLNTRDIELHSWINCTQYYAYSDVAIDSNVLTLYDVVLPGGTVNTAVTPSFAVDGGYRATHQDVMVPRIKTRWSNYIGKSNWPVDGYFYGKMPEIIIYNKALTATERNKVQSYLATKYGLTLDQTTATNYTASNGTAVWNATTNSNYKNNITGIGRDNASGLNQKQSQSHYSDFIISMGLGSIAAHNLANTNSFSTDNSFMYWSDDGGDSLYGLPISDGRPVTASFQRMARTWKVQETGSVGTVQVAAPLADGYLVVSDDSTFSYGNIWYSLSPVSVNGVSNLAANVNFTNGQFFTFANTFSVAMVTQPVSSDICEGNNTSFSVTAAGKSISYLWQISTNGGTSWTDLTNGGVYSGITTNVMSINGATSIMDGDQFRCNVTNGFTSILSDSAMLTVNSTISITADPDDVTICSGANASFSASASGGAISYSWQLSTNGGTSWTNPANGGVYSGVYTSTLSITGATAGMNNYRYRCMANNICYSGISNPAMLTVNSSSANTPTVSVSASPSTTICKGASVTFTATPTNGGTAPSYVWGINGMDVGTGSSYHSTGLENGDIISCVMTSNATCASPVTATKNTVMTVNTIVAVTTQPVYDSICAGGITTYSISATGSAPISYQWQLSTDGGAIWSNQANNSMYSGMTASTMSITGATAGMKGYQYRCQVLNTCGNDVSANVEYKLFSLSGSINYQSNTLYPLYNVSKSTKVMLYRSGNSIACDSASLTGSGYTLSNLQPGTYNLGVKTNLKAGGINATDALIIEQSITGLTQINKIRRFAGETRITGLMTSADALNCKKYFAHIINTFPAGDWTFAAIIPGTDSIKICNYGSQYYNVNNSFNKQITSKDITLNIRALCVGDLNGSRPVSTSKTLQIPDVRGEIITEPGAVIDLPVYLTNNAELGAVSLSLGYPADKIQIEDIILNNPQLVENDLVYNVDSENIYLAWTGLQPWNISSREAFLTIRLKISGSVAMGEEIIGINSIAEVEFANRNAEPMNDLSIVHPAIKIKQGEIEGDLYLGTCVPNPVNSYTTIPYYLPSDGMVELSVYNILGECIKVIVSEEQAGGKYEVRLETDNLSDGVYAYALKFTNRDNSRRICKKMVVNR